MAFSGISKEQIMRKSFDKDELTNTVKKVKVLKFYLLSLL